jgi:hypothetical protein
MNDIPGKSIHGDVYNARWKICQVGFELQDGKIVPKALGRGFTNEAIEIIEKTGAEKLLDARFREELLGRSMRR